METGGEPPIKKELSDIERRLMLLITAPHLRDKELPEAGLSVVKCGKYLDICTYNFL